MSSALDARAANAALSPVREALMAAAHADARQAVQAAEHDAAAALAEARARAEDEVRAARRDGEAQAATALAGELGRARRHARSLVLAAQRATWEELRRAVCAAALALQEDPDWPSLREALRQWALEQLGPGAQVSEVPGGVVAELGPRRVELNLASLALARLDARGPDVAGLWSP